jgi:hypothetical protein
MELLGHSQMRTTMDIYSHVMPALAREAADRMGAVLLTSKGRQTATTICNHESRRLRARRRKPCSQGWS